VCYVCCVCKINWYDARAHGFLGKFSVQSVHQPDEHKMKPSPPVHRKKKFVSTAPPKRWGVRTSPDDANDWPQMRHIGGLFNRSDLISSNPDSAEHGRINRPQLTDPSSKGCEAGVLLPLSKPWQTVSGHQKIHLPGLPDLIGGQPIKLISSDSR